MGFIPEELIAEILSYLDVKTILRLKCVGKSWNTLTSDPTFVEKHLNNSSQNPHLTLILYTRLNDDNDRRRSLVPFPVRRLLENSSITIQNEALHQLESRFENVGSCNGLVCLFYNYIYATQHKYRCSFWNPSTRTIYKNLVVLRCDRRNCDGLNYSCNFKFTFGYDDSTRTYKVVAYHIEVDKHRNAFGESEVKVFSAGDGDNCWRNIQSFPVIPFDWGYYQQACAKHLNGTINWLAIKNYFRRLYSDRLITHVEQFVIVSLDLSTETYKQLLLPQGFDEVPFDEPSLNVLMGCLCFSHDSKKTELVVWQMKEYGVQESWTRLFKISQQNLQMHFPDYVSYSFCLYKNGDTVIFANLYKHKVVMYNLRDQRGETIKITDDRHWCSVGWNYVESLVSVP